MIPALNDRSRLPGRDNATRFRRGEPIAALRLGHLSVGDQVLVANRVIALVWDPVFMPGVALVKPKYLRQADGWAKVPHSFTESEEYDAFRDQHGLDQEVASGVRLPIVANDQSWSGWPAVPVVAHTSTERTVAAHSICDALGLPPMMTFVTGSLATGLHARSGFDLDLVIRCNALTAKGLRAEIVRRVIAGQVTVEESSRSLQLAATIFGQPAALLLAEGRYAESLRLGGLPVSLMYAIHDLNEPAVVRSAEPWQRGMFRGIARETAASSGKRSSWQLECDDGPLAVICYHLGGNLVLGGDLLSLTGWVTRDARGQRTLMQFAVHRDTIAWTPKA